MSLVQAVSLVVVGFVACAEFGSYAFVHPVIRRLPVREQLVVEQGLLGTFGRFMPAAMTLTPVLAGSCALAAEGRARALAQSATAVTLLALVTTIAVNVGINRATGRWDVDHPPANWAATRRRWDTFQGVRSWLLLGGFVLLAAATV
jgi:hypothetical protein